MYGDILKSKIVLSKLKVRRRPNEKIKQHPIISVWRRNVIMITATGCFCFMSAVLLSLVIICSSGVIDARNNYAITSTYADIEEMCKSLDKTLPLPQNQEDENKFIDDLLAKFANETKCRFVFYGYKASKNIRYRSLNGALHWPPLSANSSVGIPSADRECYELSYMSKKFELLSTVRCDTKQKWNLIFLTKNKGIDVCFKHRYRCAQMYDGITRSVMDNFKTALNSTEDLYAMMPLDIDQIPKGLIMSRPSILPAVAMAVQYDFQYEYRGIYMRYKPTTFTVIDPEYDCIAYDIKKRKVVTANCDKKGCPICV